MLIAVTVVLAPAKAAALSNDQLIASPVVDFFKPNNFSVLQTAVPKEDPKPPSILPAPKPEPKRYQVRAGDNLTTVAESNGTSWLRLWNKNTDISNPDLIAIDQVILIPDNAEVLADRPVPVRVVLQLSQPTAPQTVARGPVAGNNYTYGYCTWYVKNRRPDLPNNLGDAHSWFVNAAAQGYPTGSKPLAGAVGVTEAGPFGHVVYVEAVNPDGTILVSEMNYRGWNIQSTRTTSASEFRYIY